MLDHWNVFTSAAFFVLFIFLLYISAAIAVSFFLLAFRLWKDALYVAEKVILLSALVSLVAVAYTVYSFGRAQTFSDIASIWNTVWTFSSEAKSRFFYT